MVEDLKKIGLFTKKRKKWLALFFLALVMFGGALIFIEGYPNSPFSYATFK